jgi:hypothetical protein
MAEAGGITFFNVRQMIFDMTAGRGRAISWGDAALPQFQSGNISFLIAGG